MADSVTIQNLFQAGLTRERFLDRYADLKAKANPELSSSVFSKNMSAAAINAMFDVLDTTHDNILDENEIKGLANLTTQDGQDTLTDDDISALYEKTVQNITSQYGSATAEEMYEKSVNSGDFSQFEYTQMISSQIGIINELIQARNLESKNKINRYQIMIDDLILRSSKISTETKTQYSNISESLKRSEKFADEAKMEAERLHDEMVNLEANIKYQKEKKEEDRDENDIKKQESDYGNLAAQYASWTGKMTQYSGQILKFKKSLEDLQQKAFEEDSGLKSRVDALNKKIDDEKASTENDIGIYQTSLNNLNAAQEYALAQPAENISGDYSDADTENFSYDAAELKSKWAVKGEPQFSDGFYNKVVEISKRIGCDPNALMGVMKSESSLKTTAVNKHSKATGLIQFMPTTAKNLGTSTEALSKMSPEEQLSWVEKYLLQNKKMAGFKEGDKLDAGTLYTLVFLPAYAKRDVLCTSETNYYKCNAGLDLDHDGQITKKDMNRRVHQYMK